MSMSEWAEQECKIACKKENPDWDEKSFDYGCSCYQLAEEILKHNELMKITDTGYGYGYRYDILVVEQ